METISIVGGGIAGLALAACLDETKFQVTVYEKRPELPTVGTALGMWPNAQRALARLGVLDEARAVSPAVGRGSIKDALGQAWITVDGGDMFGISRIDLLRLLHSAVPASVRRITAMVNSVPAGTGLVVGADGVHSVVRREVWGTRTEGRSTPYLAVRGTVPSSVDISDVGEYWGRGDLFGVANVAGGTNWYGSYRSNLGPAGIDAMSVLEQTRQHFARHAPVIRRVLAEATPAGTLVHRIWTTPLLRSFVRGNVVLIGDAAHAMTPNLGRGACESLVDAATLAELLNTLPLQDALGAYDRQRRLRTQALGMASYAMMRVAMADSVQPLRDRLLNLARRRQARTAVASSSSG